MLQTLTNKPTRLPRALKAVLAAVALTWLTVVSSTILRNFQLESLSFGIESPVISDSKPRVNTEVVTPLDVEIKRQTSILEGFTKRFYVYPQKNISFPDYRQSLLEKGVRWTEEFQPMFVKEELEFLQHMEQHPLRTFKITEADLFLIPLPIGAVVQQGKKVARESFNNAFATLLAQPSFNGGLNHFLFSFTNVALSCGDWVEEKNEQFGLRQHYRKLKNVTIVRRIEKRLWQESIVKTGIAAKYSYDHEGINATPLSRSSVAIQSVGASSTPFHHATYEKFANAPLTWYYRVRTNKPYGSNSTLFRMAPIELKDALNAMTNNSLGFPVPKDQFLYEVSHSKFCLAVRGDDPTSVSVWNGVHTGCIPVVVSDLYRFFGPCLSSTLNFSDYTISIPEQKFLENPVEAMANVTKLGAAEIQEKLKGMRFAQRVGLPDHPNSLFAQALLREVMLAQENLVTREA